MTTDERTVRIGHGIVVGGLTILGVWSFVSFVLDIPAIVHGFQQLSPPLKGTGVAVSIDLRSLRLTWVPVLVCAWGIWKWQRWAQVLTIALCGLILVSLLVAMLLFGTAHFSAYWIARSIGAAAIIVWLILPPVRARFRI